MWLILRVWAKKKKKKGKKIHRRLKYRLQMEARVMQRAYKPLVIFCVPNDDELCTRAVVEILFL